MTVYFRIFQIVICLVVILVVATLSFAHNKVVVIPLGGGNEPFKNVVTVAKQNGMFTDPAAAMASITDASAGTPYLLAIGPGVFTVTDTLVMKEYVDISGSGMHATLLKGAISSSDYDQTSAIVQGAENASLQSLGVENTGGAQNSFAIYNDSASPVLNDLKITVSGGGQNYGIFNYNSSSPRMTDISIIASGGSGTRGVYNYLCSPTLSGISITASGGNGNYGVYNASASPTISDMNINTSGGNDTYGVYNSSSSYPTISNSTIIASNGVNNRGILNQTFTKTTLSDMIITASGGTTNYGVYNVSYTSKALIRGSVITGSTNSVYANTGAGTNETYISDSILSGDISGSPQCSFVFDESGAAISCP